MAKKHKEAQVGFTLDELIKTVKEVYKKSSKDDDAKEVINKAKEKWAHSSEYVSA